MWVGVWFSSRLYYPFGKGPGQHIVRYLKNKKCENERTCKRLSKSPRPRYYLLQRCPRSAPGPLTPGPRSPLRASLVYSLAALCTSTSRVLVRNPMGSAGVGKTTTLPAVRALPENCTCVHSICCGRPASPSPAWFRTALRLTLLFVGLFTCQSIRTSSTLTGPDLRLHACGSVRTLDYCALSVCKCWPAEPQVTPHPPVVAKSCRRTNFPLPNRPGSELRH